MDLSTKTPEEILKLVNSSDDKDTMRLIADHVGVTYSGNTGIETLRNKLLDSMTVAVADVEEEEDEDVAPDPALMAALKAHQAEKAANPLYKENKDGKLPPLSVLITMNERDPKHSEALRRAIIRAKALRLIRCRIQNLDPADSAVPATLITCYNKYTGKISKLVPFGDENEAGYHLPKIIVDELRSRTFNMRKEKKRKGSSFGVKEYVTIPMRKFAIEELPPLTKEELKHLADDQKARGAIDRT